MRYSFGAYEIRRRTRYLHILPYFTAWQIPLTCQKGLREILKHQFTGETAHAQHATQHATSYARLKKGNIDRGLSGAGLTNVFLAELVAAFFSWA